MYGNTVRPSRFPPFFRLWMVVVAFACLLVPLTFNTAGAQTFAIDLDKVGAVYDELYPARTAVALWDTVRYDFDRIKIGNQRFRVPHFLTTPNQTTQFLVDYRLINGYRVTFRYPLTHSLRSDKRDEGAYRVPVARDFDVPGMEIAIISIDSLAADLYRRSLRDTWLESVRLAVTTQVRGDLGGSRGITIKIPVPMPKQLESLFGPSDKTHINISGRESITFSGETRVVKPFIGVEGRQSQSLFPSLDMKQDLDVSLTGTIGDKVHVRIDHSSQAVTEDANRISVNYQGYDDDVIKLIELGNTSLSLPGSQLVSFSTQSKGLFGVKVLAQLGSTDITFIASKQEGETSSASFTPTGGSIGSAETVTRRDVDYVKNKYFFFDHPLVFVGVNDSARVDVYRSVTSVEVGQNPGLSRFPGRAFVDRGGFGDDIELAMQQIALGQKPAQASLQREFTLLVEGIDYQVVLGVFNEADRIIGIELTQPITDLSRVLAVRYTNRQQPFIANQFGVGGQFTDWGINIDTASGQLDTLALEVLWAGNQSNPADPAFGWTWAYMMRHIYNLGLSNIDGDTFVLEIDDRLNTRLDQTHPQGSDVPYIQIFGLDRFDISGNEGPDGRVDISTGVVDLNQGLLFMPWTIAVYPGNFTIAQADTMISPHVGFWPDSTLVTEWTSGKFQFTGERAPQWLTSRRIYTENINQSQEFEVNLYNIRVTAVSTSKTFRIDAFNIIENSEVVSMDGSRLTRGSDYDIDYETGEVTLRGGALDRLSPDSRITIDYEFKGFGGSSSSNLVGFNAISRHGDAVLGTTWLYESKNVATEKPRVGEEPTRGVVGGFNGSLSHQSKKLTSLVNKLPLVDTDAPSSLTVNGEVAVSFPDPNTRGEVWVDDFEGVEDSDRVGLSRRNWSRASPPLIPQVNGPGAEQDPDGRLDFDWYNIEPELSVTKRDLNPELDDRENTTIQALDIDLDALPVVGDTTSWVGVMTGFGGGGLDLTNTQFIEFWVNDFHQDPLSRTGKIRVDVGTIDEDFFEPKLNKLNDEDKGRDGFAAAFDDTGLDGLFNEDEPGYNDGAVPDPKGDDFDLSRIDGRFSKVNGTEGNRVYDTEDLDGNSQLDEFNSYFSFIVDLADSASVDIFRDFPSYEVFSNPKDFHRHDAWRKYRIRIADAQIVAPPGVTPRLDQIRHLRIWFNDVRAVIPESAVRTDIGPRFQISEFQFQGNRWLLDGIHDLADEPVDTLAVETDFAIGVISTKTDPGIYQSPSQPRADATGIQDKESSLVLSYDSLAAGNDVRIRKQFAGNGLNLIQYRDLHFWVNTDSVRSNVEYFFRIGTNSTNYYEVALPLTPEYFPRTPGWHRVSVSFSDLTNLKFGTPDSTNTVHGVARDALEPDLAYPVRARGNPSLFQVRFLYAGVRNTNPNPLSLPVSGRVWLNDIFLGDVRRDIDFAQRLGFSANLAGGIISLGGAWSRTGPDYRGLRQRNGSGSTEESLSLNSKASLQHFVPLAGFQVPVTVRYSKATSKPKFRPNSDTEITSEAIRDSLKTERVSRAFSTSLQKSGSKNALLKYTIDRITTNFSYSENMSSAPAARDTSTSMSGTFGYQINWAGKKEVRIPLINARFRWWPNSLTYRSSATRRTTKRWRNLDGEFKRDPFLFSASLVNSGSANYRPFQDLSTTFNMTTNRDVGLRHEWFGVNVGREIGRSHSLRVGWKPKFKLIKAFGPDIDANSTYREDSSPNVRRAGDPRETRNASASRSGSLRAKLGAGSYLKKLFGFFGWEPEAKPARVGGGRVAPPVAPPVATPVAPPVATPVAAGTDSSAVAVAVAAADSTPRPRPGASYALKKLGTILTEIRQINMSFTQRSSSNYSRIPERPSLNYQFGLTSNAGPSGFADPERLTTSLSMNFDTGVSLSENLDVKGRYSRSVSDSDLRASSTRSTNVTWPDLQFSWKGLEQYGLFRRYFASAQANFNFRSTHSESGRKNEKPDNTRDNLEMSPSIVFAWKNDLSTNVSSRYAKNTVDTRGSKSETTDLSVSVDFRKTFRGGAGFRLPIPLFRRKLQWSSQLETNMTLAYARTGGKRFNEGSAFSEPIPRTTTLRIEPNVRYNFTNALSGSTFINFSRQYNEASDQTVTGVRVGVNVVFTF